MGKDVARLLDEEAEAVEVHRDDDVPLVRSARPAKEPAQVYSLRIPVEKLEELRRLAEERHLTPSALMRSWVLERLDQESSGENLVAVVRRAVRDELAVIWSTSSARDESEPVAGDRTSVPPGSKARTSRRVGRVTSKNRKGQALVAKNRKSAASG